MCVYVHEQVIKKHKNSKNHITLVLLLYICSMLAPQMSLHEMHEMKYAMRPMTCHGTKIVTLTITFPEKFIDAL